MQTIEINMNEWHEQEDARRARRKALTELANPATETQVLAVRLLADIVSDAPKYGSLVINGKALMDTIITDPAMLIIEHIQALESALAEATK